MPPTIAHVIPTGQPPKLRPQAPPSFSGTGVQVPEWELPGSAVLSPEARASLQEMRTGQRPPCGAL